MGSATRRTRWLIGGAAVVVAAGVVITATVLHRPAETQPQAAPTHVAVTPTHTPTPTETPTPTPTRTGPAANTATYDLSRYPQVDVYAVNPKLPVDSNPNGKELGLQARPAKAAIPVFATATSAAPVARLAQIPRESGGAFPVIANYTDWVEVLLLGRHGVPPQGNSHQTVGWLRAADVRLVPNSTSIVVTLSKHTIDLVNGAGTTRITSDFGWGTPATPTPVGRTFVMEVARNPALGYTRGHPLVYLATQSPTLAGFDGQDVAVTAIHYHDARSGRISNGCIRVDANAIELLDKVPAGTPVYIRS